MLYCWGRNSNGQLSNGKHFQNVHKPKENRLISSSKHGTEAPIEKIVSCMTRTVFHDKKTIYYSGIIFYTW